MEIKPITRGEMFLAKIGGQDVQTPTPITRKEMFLQKIAENGSGGSGGGGASGVLGVFISHNTESLDGEITCNVTYDEIYEAYGKKCIVCQVRQSNAHQTTLDKVAIYGHPDEREPISFGDIYYMEPDNTISFAGGE
jgi:hypothetical protein